MPPTKNIQADGGACARRDCLAKRELWHKPGLDAVSPRMSKCDVLGAEVRDGGVLRQVARREPPEGNMIDARLFDLAAGAEGDAVPVDEEFHHHRRVVEREAALLAFVVGVDGGEVHGVDGVTDEPGQVFIGQLVVEAGRQEECLVRVVGLIRFGQEESPRQGKHVIR